MRPEGEHFEPVPACPHLADADDVRIVLIAVHEPQLATGCLRDERSGMQQPLSQRLTVPGAGAEGHSASHR